MPHPNAPKIKDLRERIGTQEELAFASEGVFSKSWLERLENGQTRKPSIEKMRNLAELLGVEVDELWEEDEVGSAEEKRRMRPGFSTNGRTITQFYPLSACPPECLFGRDDELALFHECLENDRSLSVIGDYLIGKSSLLSACKQHAEETGRTVKRLDLKHDQGFTLNACLTTITGQTVSQHPDTAVETLQTWCNEEQSKTGYRPVVLVDDADRILAHWDYQFLTRLRGQLDQGRVIFVFASRGDLHEWASQKMGKDSPFYNVEMSIHQLALLSDGAVADFWNNAKSVSGIETDAQFQEWAGAHPYFLQLLGACLLTQENTATALKDFQRQAYPRVRAIWDGLPPKQQQRLQQFTEGESGRHGALSHRGILTQEGKLFGRILFQWIQEHIC